MVKRKTGHTASNCARIKRPVAEGPIPENVSVNVLAKVTDGLAKLVDEVNQYPAEIYRPTRRGTAVGR